MATGTLVKTKVRKTQLRKAQLRELAYRSNAGLHVTLLWDEADDTLAVIVVDEPAATVLRVQAERHNALDVFNHPFAYA